MKKPDTGQPEQLLAMLRKSIDVASDAVFWLDDAGRFVYVNDSACSSVGYSAQELQAMRLPDVNPTSTPAGWKELLETIRRAGTIRLESVHRRKDGSLFPVEIVSTHVTFEGKEYVNGFARDITARKLAEAALRQRVEELSALHSTVLDITAPHQLSLLLQTLVERAVHLLHADGGGLYLCDLDERTAHCVVSFRTPRDYVGTQLGFGEGAAGIVAETGQPLLIADYGSWPRRAAAFEMDKPFRSVVAVPMLWQGRVTGVIDALRMDDPRPFTPDDLRLLGLFADHAAIARENARLREGLEQELAQRKRIEEERIDLERRMFTARKLESIGLLAGGVAHDFNNMLAVILGYADLLGTELPPDSLAREYLAEMVTAADKSRGLTRQLLAIGQRQPMEMKPLDLNRAIRGVESILRRTIRENVAINVSLTPGLGLVMADAGQVEQVILNLTANAQDAMPHGGTISLQTREVELDAAYAKDHVDASPGRYALLAVADTGQGMSEDTLRRIFDPFFTTKSDARGTGLGLPTVYGIVKQHRGNVDVQSSPGKGTIFKVCFPMTDALLPHKAAERVEDVEGGGETILVVEDQDQMRELVSRLLRERGYRVLDANSGTSALQVAARLESPIDLLVTDVILEGMNGREVYARLARERDGLKVLYMSGYPGDVLSEQGFPSAGFDLIQKPFTPRAFADKVREILRGA